VRDGYGSGFNGNGGQPRPYVPQSHADVLPTLWRHRLLIVVVTLLGAATAYGLSQLQTTQYEATAQMILADPGSAAVFDDTRLIVDPTRHARTQAELASSGPVLARVSVAIGGRLSVKTLDDVVSVRASRDLDLVTIHALDVTPEGAAQIADAVGLAYQEVVAADVATKAGKAIAELEEARTEIQTRVVELEAAISDDPDNAALRAERDAAVVEAVNLEGRARQIAVDAALYGSGVELFEPADIPEGPARPLPLRNAIFGGVIALIAGSAFAWWRSQKNLVADRRHDPAPILGAPLLGVVPEFEDANGASHAPALTDPRSAAAEAYNFIAASLIHALGDRSRAAILVTSPGEGDGKTVTAFNAAVAIARGGKTVVIVDGDERVRGLTRWLKMPRYGLTDLGEGYPFEDCSRLMVGWDGASFSVVAAGSPADNTAGFFGSPRFGRAMSAIREQGDVVVMDSPPALVVADAMAMAGHVDGVVVVIRQGTPLDVIEDVRDRIEAAGTPILGYVFNRVRKRPSRNGYDYVYGGYTSDRVAASANGRKGSRRAVGSGREHR
jgi:Mrp family chromosome partitioning ATPase